MRLGESFTVLAATNRTEPLLVGDKPLPRPTGLDVPIPNEPFANQSHLHVEGELASRRLVAPLELRRWPSRELLSHTVVQAVVDADGYVLAATLLAESGSPEADADALRQASGVRFEPLRQPRKTLDSDRGLGWGELIFEWVTSPPAAAPRAEGPP